MRGIETKSKAELIALVVEKNQHIENLHSRLASAERATNQWQDLQKQTDEKRAAAEKRALEAEAALGRWALENHE